MIFIKEYRKATNMTQAQLAEKLGVSRQSIVRFENGACEPRLSELKKMSVLFGCKIDDLSNPTQPPAGLGALQGEMKTD